MEKVLRIMDPAAYHPVTWEDTGLVPFSNGDMYFDSWEELQCYIGDIWLQYGILVLQ